jgi:3-phenylpropionate/trans-cinnamate dioxygenase ferredoxin reductase component
MAERTVDFLLVGGGIASGNCARWLRRSGADGSIVLVGREPHLPYDRPPLSKGYLRGSEAVDDALMQDAGWYEEQEIEALTKVSAMKLDLQARTVKLSNREVLGFGQLLLATGSNVRRLNVDGDQYDGIHYLRTFANSDAIREDAAGKRVVLIGGSYIGSEVAASLTELGSRCTIVMMEPLPLSRTFGDRAGRWFADLLTDHGIELHGSDELDHFEGADGRVTKVFTKNGLELDADAVVIGAGVHPDIMLARSAGLELGDSGGIRTDSQLRASAPGVFAAGDVAEYSSVVHDGAQIRVEHWDVAFGHGKTVALNMLGKGIDHDVVPYFFSDISDWAGIEYVGPAREWDQEIVRGSFDEGAFTVFYLQAGRVRGALTVGRSDDLQAARRLIADGTELGQRAHVLSDISSDLETIS